MKEQISPDVASSKNPIIAGLDIGSTKIAIVVAQKNDNGKLEVLGFGSAPSQGVEHAQVININQTTNAIALALQRCYQSNPHLHIDEVYVGVAGKHIRSLANRGDMIREHPDAEIAYPEIDKLIADQKKIGLPAGDRIIDVIPQDFQVDDRINIVDPIGYTGVRFGANFHIVTADQRAINNIYRAVVNNNLVIKDFVLEPIASAHAVLTPVDIDAGVVVLDIGGGTTDLAIFSEGVLRYTAVIAFGGENITADIKKGLSVLKNQAEKLKTEFGSAFPDEADLRQFITVPGIRDSMPSKEICVHTLSQVIHARMAEILDFVNYNMRQAKINPVDLAGGIIVTGGGAQLKNVKQLTEYITSMNTRIGTPDEYLASNPNFIAELRKPIYSTCIGLVLKGFKDMEYEANKMNRPLGQQVKIQSPIPLSHKETSVQPLSDKSAVEQKPVDVSKRKLHFWERFTASLIDLFKAENDTEI
ncbi:MAG: cell division protein FtsA [Phycisphaerales bacterium]|nr:cell division protein FtsA [Phycisphaerales bacterium]